MKIIPFTRSATSFLTRKSAPKSEPSQAYGFPELFREVNLESTSVCEEQPTAGEGGGDICD
jgi:hypothetical protein